VTEANGIARSILIVNPNTSSGITDILTSEARRIASADITIRGVTAPFGSASLESQAELVISAHAVLEAVAANADCDAVIIGAFGDPGFAAVEEIAPMPVFGLARSGIAAAGAGGRRFAIITLGELMRGSILRAVQDMAMGNALVGLHVLQGSVLGLARDRADFLDAMTDAANKAVTEQGAEAILFGGAPFAGIGREIGARVKVPVFDGLTCAVNDAVAALSSHSPKSVADGASADAKPMVQVSPALAGLINSALRRS
jgi:Asp/Glu/hydantoin racemase